MEKCPLPALLCILLALFLAFGMGCPSPQESRAPAGSTGHTKSTQPNESTEPIQSTEFQCFLVNPQANSLGIGGTDIGLPVERSDGTTWILFGDVKGTTSGKGGASALAISPTPFNCSSFSWKSDGERFYQPLHSARNSTDASTVPAGAIELDGKFYIYAMRVTQWAFNSGPGAATEGHGMLFRQENSTFVPVASWAQNTHTSAAPVIGRLEDGTEAVFIAFTNKYRDSQIYGAYVLPSEIEGPSKYHYFAGMENGEPRWGDESSAVPIKGLYANGTGEISLAYNPVLKKYLLMFKDYKGSRDSFYLYSADNPWGPYSLEKEFTPCGTAGDKPSWMEEGWSGCYGGYIFPNSFGADGKDIYFTVSVWVPYTTIVSKGRMD